MKGDKMKPWYDDIDVATLQRIKTYSAFCDYKSQNLMLQTLYEAMQKKIDEYKQTNRGIAKDYADLQKQVKELQQENAELKADNDARKFAMAMSEKVEKQLREENAELKEKLGDAQMQKAGEKSNLVWKLKTANEQKADQLTKAKEIIKNLMVFAEIDSREYEENYKEAEQFLKEVGECL